MTLFYLVAAVVGAFFIWTVGYTAGRTEGKVVALEQAYGAEEDDVQ